MLRKYFDTHFRRQCVITGLWLAVPAQLYRSLYTDKTVQTIPNSSRGTDLGGCAIPTAVVVGRLSFLQFLPTDPENWRKFKDRNKKSAAEQFIKKKREL